MHVQFRIIIFSMVKLVYFLSVLIWSSTRSWFKIVILHSHFMRMKTINLPDWMFIEKTELKIFVIMISRHIRVVVVYLVLWPKYSFTWQDKWSSESSLLKKTCYVNRATDLRRCTFADKAIMSKMHYSNTPILGLIT